MLLHVAIQRGGDRLTAQVVSLSELAMAAELRERGFHGLVGAARSWRVRGLRADDAVSQPLVFSRAARHVVRRANC